MSSHVHLEPDEYGLAWCPFCRGWVKAGYPVMYLDDTLTEDELIQTRAEQDSTCSRKDF